MNRFGPPILTKSLADSAVESAIVFVFYGNCGLNNYVFFWAFKLPFSHGGFIITRPTLLQPLHHRSRIFPDLRPLLVLPVNLGSPEAG